MPKSKRDSNPGGRLPTMKDVARLAGVHQTTVSLALRNHPSVAEKTRERIRAAAERLGYRPDPLLDAFNEHRLAVNPTHNSSVIAYVVDERVAADSRPGNYVQARWEGVKKAAEERGLKVERFILGKRHLSPERLNQILVTRSITGVIIGGVSMDTRRIGMEWHRFSTVRIESRHVDLAVDTVSGDQRLAVRLAVRNLRRLGYRRIGLTTARADERRLGEPMTSGFLVEENTLAEEHRVPPYLYSAQTGPEGDPGLIEWIRKYKIEAVISNWGNVPDVLREAGMRIPDDIVYAALDIRKIDSDVAGVMQNHELVGRTAVEHLAILLHTHQRGELSAPATTYVPGFWRDGMTAPPRAESVAPSGAEATVDPRALV